MSITLAMPDDLKRLTEMAVSFFNASHYKDYGIDTDRVRDLVSEFLGAKDSEKCTIVLRDAGTAVGVLAALATTNIFNFQRACGELIWWIDPEYRTFKHASRMLTVYEYWAKNIAKAQVMQLVALDDTLDGMYKRKGFTRSELAYSKNLRS